jgi:hypothetical protein
MIVTLAETMNIPLRERNALFLAARYAPEYSETNLDAPELVQVRRAIEILCRKHGWASSRSCATQARRPLRS